MKKILTRSGIALATVAVVLAGAAAFSAYEAHIVNVTATIDNATSISTEALAFGQVFPQEILHQPVTLALSQSFTQSGALGVDYVIKQKPKCVLISTEPTNGQTQYVPATEDGQGVFQCPEGYHLMPLLCPFLSKTSTVDGDVSVPSFHGPTTTPEWNESISVASQAVGHLTQKNPSTTWDIDLHVPCFKGECAQDWAKYVHDANPNASPAVDPNAYMLDPSLKTEALGCDLWYELTSVNRAVAGSEVVYNSVPDPLSPNYPSQPFQAQQTSEFGDYIHLAGTARTLKTVTVTMSDWALFADYTGDARYNGNSSTWTHPITINIYSNHLNGSGVPDTLLATKTQNINIPWRPVGDATCPDTGYGAGFAWKAGDGNCYNGYVFNAVFDLSSLNATLPNDVIVGIVYNTQTYGPAPIGSNGPYNSLNVAVPTNDPVTVGSDDSANEVFWNTSTASWYADHGAAGVGIFRKDINWSPNGTVALKIEAQ